MAAGCKTEAWPVRFAISEIMVTIVAVATMLIVIIELHYAFQYTSFLIFIKLI